MSPRASKRSSDDRGRHGGRRLHGVTVDHYGLAVRDAAGEFVGDRASETGFFRILDRIRTRERTGPDPFGPARGPKTNKDALDRVLRGGDPDAAHLVHLAIEAYA
ncbi:hypothetical protein [Lysobacter humi (ex Lee et al. 2017)]